MENFNLDNEWEQFMNTNFDIEKLIEDNINKKQNEIFVPKCSDIYISTKTKIAYLNQPIDIEKIFWLIPIMEYYNTNDGVIKKQMKITTFSEEETNKVNDKLNKLHNQKSVLISHFKDKKTKNDIKYKHIQKISVGTCKKDIMTYRSKEKGAFYNCFAIIVRLKIKEIYKEIHIKIFNTGKLEIPGIQDDELLYKSLNFLVDYLKPFIFETLSYNKLSIDTVLINSNFNCGYYIDREALFNKLKHTYKLITMFDPCSYPGIQSKFYFNENKIIQDGICNCSRQCSKKGSGDGNGECREISFMIFRTGSVLIVGHCNEDTLNIIYNFIKKILEKEYFDINEGNITSKEKKNVIKKVRKYKIIQDN
jgi:TATA-box binding protein (TBP) (component of TFIID and TFIIIB)